jgi:hypothetical protein
MNGKPQFSILYLFSFAAIFLKDNVTTIVLTLTKLNDFR